MVAEFATSYWLNYYLKNENAIENVEMEIKTKLVDRKTGKQNRLQTNTQKKEYSQTNIMRFLIYLFL